MFSRILGPSFPLVLVTTLMSKGTKLHSLWGGGKGVADGSVCVGCCEGQGASHKPGCKTLIKEVRMKKSEDSLSWCRTNT